MHTTHRLARRSPAVFLYPALLPALAGCTAADRLNLADRTGGNAALYGQIQAFDGHSGRRLTFDEVVRRCAAVDVVFFGEQHNDPVCNAYQAQLLFALLDRTPSTALAMEFFETDTQDALDADLAGRAGEPAFIEQTRQVSKYWLSHRPLIEMCRARGAPVIAANTPRRLVREYRTARLPFDEFRASRSPEDQRWLPSTSEHLEGPYFERFIEVMKSHPPAPTATAPASAPAGESVATQPHATDDSAPSEHDREALVRSFRPQLLWDDTMAESVANFRAAHSFRRVMLIVGRFHVEHQGGTLQKFRQRRPDDRVCTLVYTGRPDAAFAIDPEDVGAGDIVLSGISPPDTPTQPPQPTTAPAPAP